MISRSLYCRIDIPTKRGSIYWWPLIFEAMRRKAFNYTAPDQPEGVGYYYYVRKENVADTDFVKAAFRTAWDEIYSETSQTLLSFWYHSDNSFPLDISTEQKKEENLFQIYLYLNDAYLFDEALEVMRFRIRLAIECAKSIYEICKPCTGEMLWSDTDISIASFGKPLITPLLEEARPTGQEIKLIVQELPEKGQIYFVDPIPVPTREGWKLLPLEQPPL